MDFKLLKQNSFGFFELAEKPSVEELNNYYQNKYYQQSCGSYEKEYSNEELQYIQNKLEQKYDVLSSHKTHSVEERLFLDVGAGEGWALSFFKTKGWSCTGLDYSRFGCQTHNPDCLPDLIAGDIYESIDSLMEQKRRFDVILLDNVLEHVREPLALLEKLHTLMRPEGLLIIEVPNDCSVLQQYLLEQGYISTPFWIVVPDHISYFNHQGLAALGQAAGWKLKDMLGDFPIDFNLLNSATNYVENKTTGKSCHQVRVAVENLLHGISPKETNNFYRQLAKLGMGRQIIGFFQKEENVI